MNLSVHAALLALALGAGQHTHDPSNRGPATLVTGLGHLHHEIATKNPEAQRFFDQGLTFVYAFNHDEAVRSFRRAAELDPGSPMPHWGIALALGPNINLDVDPEREKAAYDEAQRARALASGAPPGERALVDALAFRYSNDPKADLKALAVKYADAMREVVRRFPDDLDAAALFAESLMDLRPWQLWTSDGKPAEGTEEIVPVLESVLKRDPSHIGANHYYIHAVEASPMPERAMASAYRLGTLVPAAGHLVHMPAHIYMRTGDYDDAVVANAQAAAVDRDYIESTRASGVYPLMYYNHNVDFLASAAMMSGAYDQALKAADELVGSANAALATMPMLEPFAAKKMYVLLRFAKWNDALALPAPDAQHLLLTAVSHFGRGVAFAKTGDVQGAEREQSAFKAAASRVPADLDWGYNKAPTILAVAAAALDARIADAKHETNNALAAWARAVKAEDAVSYNEPPDWFYPVRESLGAALLRAGRAGEAERVFRQDLEKNPRNPRSLYGLSRALAAQQNAEAAAMVERQFRAAWRRADTKLSLDDF
jgi:tetratricopeptide (TPR) repeat protein